MTVNLTWQKAAAAVRKRRLAKAQAFVDSESIRRMTPYVPVAKPYWRHAGRLRDSVTNPEPGCIAYTAPFARHDYYAPVDHRHGGNPKAQPRWFEFMKMKDAKAILRGAAAILGAKAE
jgi:hypothetical protein